jgi:DnaJ-class molecular chaperone
MALKYHPDKCVEDVCEGKFEEIATAYEILSDPHRRQEYDTTGGSKSMMNPNLCH